MKLVIDDIYSHEGTQELVRACTKVLWTRGTNRTTSWFGHCVLQTAEDLVMFADLFHQERPDFVIECGTFEGGGLAFYASILELLGHGQILGIDVNAPPDLSNVPGSKRISFLQGSSVSPEILEQVARRAAGKSVLVILDSDHSKKHVMEELEAYSKLIAPGGYLVVMDGIMTILADTPSGDPRWAGDNPEFAVVEFLNIHPEFQRDMFYNRLWITHAPGGFLRRVSCTSP